MTSVQDGMKIFLIVIKLRRQYRTLVMWLNDDLTLLLYTPTLPHLILVYISMPIYGFREEENLGNDIELSLINMNIHRVVVVFIHVVK